MVQLGTEKQRKLLNQMTRSKLFMAAVAGAFSLVLMAQQASAVTITGNLTFAGTVTPKDAGGNPVDDLSLATQLDFNPVSGALAPFFPTAEALVTSSSGHFSTSAAVDLNDPLVFKPVFTAISPFYVLIPSGIQFNLLTLTVGPGATTPQFLQLSGSGVFTGAGFDPTVGDFNLSINSANGQITGGFTASGSAAGTPPPPPTTGVPDGGSALALLGLAMVGIEGLRRKLAVA